MYQKLLDMGITLFDTDNFNIQVNRNFKFHPHKDKNNTGPSFIIGLGDYENGELILHDDNAKIVKELDIRNKCYTFDGSQIMHSTKDYTGDRYSLVFFRTKVKPEKDDESETDDMKIVNPEKTTEDDRVGDPENGWTTINVPADGQCCFHVLYVATQLYYTQEERQNLGIEEDMEKFVYFCRAFMTEKGFLQYDQIVGVSNRDAWANMGDVNDILGL